MDNIRIEVDGNEVSFYLSGDEDGDPFFRSFNGTVTPNGVRGILELLISFKLLNVGSIELTHK